VYPHHFEWLHKNIATGQLFFADVLLSPMLLAGENLIQVTIRDITQKKLAAEQTQLSARVFTSTNGNIIIANAKHVIVNVNPAFCQLTGYSYDEVIGKNPNILNSGKQGSGFYQSMWKVLDEKGYWQGELWNRKKVVKYMQSYFLFHH
jgi:PAS domain-containing protein